MSDQSQALVPIQRNNYQFLEIIQSLDDLKKIAQTLVASGLLPRSVDKPEKAVAIIIQGRELGLPMMASFNLINVIAGKPTLSPQGMLALIGRSGLSEDMTITDDGTTCTVTMKRVNRSPHTETFSQADADNYMVEEWHPTERGKKVRTPLSQKTNWQQQPKTMRKWRAVAACARVVYPDVIGGTYLPEEMGAIVDAEGEIIEMPNHRVDEIIHDARQETSQQEQRPTADWDEEEEPEMAAVGEPTRANPQPESKEPYQVGALRLKKVDGVEYVNTKDDIWKPADAKIAIPDSAQSQFEMLFKNKFEMGNHLKKHFGKALVTSLTWREFIAAILWKKDGQPTPPYYEMPNAEPVLPTFDDTVAEDLVALYQPVLEEKAQKELLRLIATLPDPYCLKPLAAAGLTIANCYDQYEALTTVLSDPKQAPKTKEELDEYLNFIIGEATATTVTQ